MKRTIALQIPIEIYENALELSAVEQSLLQKAKANLVNAYAPYSGFRVAAAVLLENGEILVGANQENAAYPMCLCAERVAIAAAHAQFPGIPLKSIVITVQNINKAVSQPVAPCGACRQVICETEFRFGHHIEIILQGEVGEIYKFRKGKDLLPLSFDGSFLGE